jgi:hypothetical protein
MSARLRSFLAIALPLLLILVGALAIGKDFREPNFVQSWSVEAKAFGLFAVTLIAFAGLALLGEVWAIRIDPDGVGRDKQPLARLIDNAGTHASIAAVVPFAAYAKDFKHIPMWPILTVVALCGLLSVLPALRAHRKINSQKK